MIHLAIFASGSGSNAENIVKYFKDHPLIEVNLIISNKADAFVLKRAHRLGIPSWVVSKQEFGEEDFIDDLQKKFDITHIVLAGFLLLIPPALIKKFPDRIINIHPALLPKYGGKGMYGDHVHDAVVAAGEKESGITIHLVNEQYDEGETLFQASCELSPDDVAEDVAAKVHQLEYEHFPRVIESWVSA